MQKGLRQLKEPQDYFKGIGRASLPNVYNILLFLRPSRKRLQQEAPQNRSHHRFVLFFNLETSGYVHIDNLALHFEPGHALLIHPYQFHHFSKLASQTLCWLVCTFETAEGSFLNPLRNRAVKISKSTERARQSLLEEWHRCSNPLRAGEVQDQLLQTAMIRLLLMLQQDGRSAAGNQPLESGDSLLKTVNRLMSEWRGKPVVIEDIANILNISSSRLRARFKESAGIPLGSYIQNYRINRAMSLLRNSTLSISDVSREAGFGSPQAFSRLFKKETGGTPRFYRHTA